MEIAVLFGGKSFEHEISIVSAIAIKKVLTCKVKFIFCSDEHEFFLIPNEYMKAIFFSQKTYKKQSKLQLNNGGFFEKKLFGEKKVEFDVVLNLIHGADGEDGVFASMFDFFGIDYIGPRLESSVLSYNKLYTKYLCYENNINSLQYQIISKDNTFISMPYPFIIKPLRLGSSLGVSIVKDQSQLQYAYDKAFEYDDMALVEPYIQNVKEYNLAGCKGKDGFIFSVIEEPQKDEMLDFDKKYKDFSRTKKVYEADISDEIALKMQEAFKKIYDPLFLGAMIRCDFFVINDEVYLNEINPNPGSMANYLYDDFNKAIIQVANNLPKKNKIMVDYNFIHSINSAKGKA